MKYVDQLLERFFPPFRPLQPGIYHYQAPTDAPKPYRLHLRIEEDGDGILIVNASTVMHLNQTAAEYAYHIIKETPIEEVIRQMAQRYRVSSEEATQDFRDLRGRLEAMIVTPDLDPVTFLNFDRSEPYSANPTAPYRIDCALTYQHCDGSAGSYAPHDRVKRELSEEEWKSILEKAWNAGIPQAIFTGGEPTLRPDLPDLVAYAENLGMVTGLITCGYRLSDTDFLHQLLLNGLDHLMIVLDPEDEVGWEALRDVLPEDIFTTVHVTVTPETAGMMDDLMRQLAVMGVGSLSLSASSRDLEDALQHARQTVAGYGFSLVWDMPVPYSQNHPVAMELEAGDQPVQGPGQGWVYVEPDGDVLPGQGVQKLLGNMLTDPWETIWKNR